MSDFLKGAEALKGANTNQGYDPSMTTKLLDNFAQGANELQNNYTYSPVVGEGGTFAPNPGYNFTDQTTINTNQEAVNGFWKDLYNDFWQSYHTTAASTYKGKLEYSMLGDFNEGPQAIIDDYPDRIADLNTRLAKGTITSNDYNAQKQSLDASYQQAIVERDKLQADVDEQEMKAEEYSVSKAYKARQQMANLQGDAASIFDKAYTLSSTIGSSASLMVPQFLATFGNKITKNLTKVAATNLIPGLGEGADIVASVAALGTSLAELAWGRAQESYGEVDQAIQASRQSLIEKYMYDHNMQDPREIPEDDMRKIRQQSRQGARAQFNENMALALLDIGEAVIMPLSNMGTGLSKLAKPFQVVEEALSEARNYNKFTRLMGTGVKFGAGVMGEKFEEGFQHAAQLRAQDANLVPLPQDPNKGFQNFTNDSIIRDILQDGYDTAASLDYSLIPGITLRGSGKYSNDPEFQSAEESGGVLAMIMGGIPTALSIRSDIKAYKAATKDLMNKGLLNVDDKFGALRNSVLKKYFDNDKVDFLAGALRSLAGKTDDAGNEIVSKQDADKLARDIKKAYEIFQPLAEQVDNIAQDKFTLNPVNIIAGDGFFKNSRKLQAAKEMLKEDLFNTATSMFARREELARLEIEKAGLLAKEQELFNASPEVEATLKEIASKQQAIEDLLATKVPYGYAHISGQSLNHRNSVLKEMKKEVKELRDSIDVENKDFQGSKALQDIQERIISNEIFLKESQDKFGKLNKIRTAKALYEYLGDNISRPIPKNSKINEMLADEDNEIDLSEDEQEFKDEGNPNEPMTGVEETTPEEAIKEEPQVDVAANVATGEGTDADETITQVKNDIDKALSGPTPAAKGAALGKYFGLMGIDLTNAKDALSTAVNALKNVYNNAELGKLFPALKEAIKALRPDQKELEFDAQTGQLTTKQVVPPTQSSADDINNLNWDILNKLNQNEEDPYGTGLKVTNSLSVAWVGLEGVQYEDGQWKDDRGEDGKLRFNEADDQQLNNTDAVRPGDELIIRAIGEVPAGDSIDLDSVDIGIYKRIKIGSAEREARIGYVPKLSSLRERLAESSDYVAEYNKLQQTRQAVIAAGTGAQFTTQVTKKGFGFLNKNRSTVLTTIDTVVGADKRPKITIVDDNGRPEKQGLNVRDIQGVGMTPGSTIILLPNETNEGTEYLPMYLVKNKLGEDPLALERVHSGVESFLQTGNLSDLAAVVEDNGQKRFGAKAYVYITTSTGDLSELGKSGMFASTGGASGVNITVGDRVFRAGDHGLKEALANIYFSANKDLLKNNSYQAMLRKSKLLKTNISANPVLEGNFNNGTYAFLENDQQYQYFNQHTIEFAPISAAKSEPAPTEISELPTTKDAVDELKDLGIDLNFDDISADDVSGESSEGKSKIQGIREKLLVSPKIHASLQTQMVDSIAYKLLSNTKTDETSNKEAVKKELEIVKEKADTAYATFPDKTVKAAVNVKKIADNYGLMLEHYDALVEKSRELLTNLGFVPEGEDNDFYDALEADDQDAADASFQEDSNSTRNNKEFLPAEVKKLIYFVPKLQMLSSSEEDRAVADKTGKMYKNAKNELGLDTFNNFNDTWEKVLSVTSGSFFESSLSGFNKMLTMLQDAENAPVVQEVAEKLSKAPMQVKRAFFARTNLQEQKNITFLHSVTQYVKRFFDGERYRQSKVDRRTARWVRSDRQHAEKKIREDLNNEFRLAGRESGILAVRKDEATDREILFVNTVKAEEIRQQIIAILSDNNNFAKLPAKGRLPEKITDTFSKDSGAKVRIYNLVREVGINISFPAFNDLLRYYKTSTEARGERLAVQEVFVNRILKTLSGEKKSGQKTADGYIELSRVNPFEVDSSTISSIAKQEYKYRKQWGSGAYRSADGKSYYAYTRHNYLSEMFTQIKQGIINATGDFVREKLNQDDFASTSLWLEKLNTPAEKYFRSNFELFYLLDARNEQSDNPAKQLKNMTPREHLITRLSLFQNQGKKKSMFLYDTLSDKVTKPAIEAEKHDVKYAYGTGAASLVKGNVELRGDTLDVLFRYFENEYKRINKTIADSALFNDPANKLQHKLIKGYHDIGSKEGMGKYFLNYYFLNKAFLDDENIELSSALYNSDGTLKPLTDSVRDMVKQAISNHMSKVIDKQLEQFAELELYKIELNQKSGKYDVDFTTLADRDYLAANEDFGAFARLKIPINKDVKNGYYKDLTYKQLVRAVHYIATDYVVNSVIASNEMLMFTGDPAQAGKLADGDTVAAIKSKYKEDPRKAAKYTLLAHVQSTFVNVSKRNAAFLASGERYMFDSDKYNVAIANDMAIDSDHLDEYLAMFPGNEAGVTKAYKKGDLTDAQEVTTVQEHLHVMKAAGKINDEQYKKALYIYDVEAYREEFGSAPHIKDEERAALAAIVMQPMKPVQRTFVMDNETKMSKQYYIKTSSYPLIPSQIKGGPLEELLREMRKNKVQRVAFVSGVKQGVAGSKDILKKTEEGHEYNKSFLENNINELSRSGFRIQLEVPYKQDKDQIREGTQQSKLLFVDIPDDLQLNYRGHAHNVSTLKEKYIDFHRKIVQKATDALLKEVTDRVTGRVHVRKLSQILQEEGIGRGYALNALMGLDLDEKGRFKIPLTFLPNAGQIEPVITAIVSNRIAKLKMPGKSYVQGAEFILKQRGKKGNVEEATNLDDRGIVWTKPEYKGLSKLQYLSKSEDGKMKPAQIIMPFYFIKDGERLNVEDFIDKETGLLDVSRIDPELLQMNGFRIPFQGHNSGMWFEVVGFLPTEAGDLVLVPGEIAGQMGSDYDVDKLYSYMYNYYHKGQEPGDKIVERLGADTNQWNELKRKATLKLIDEGVEAIDPENNFYSHTDFNRALGEVVNEMFPDGNVPKHRYNKTTKEVTDAPIKEGKYDINKVDSDDPQTIEELQNGIIDIQKAVYTSHHDQIVKAILEPLSFDDFKAAIDEQGAEGGSTFIGAFDPGYQMDVYFSNVTGKFGTAVGANANTSHAMAQTANLFIKGEGVMFLDENGDPYMDYLQNYNDTNRINALKHDTYTYSVKTAGGMEQVNQNDKDNVGAWRLDKVTTFDIDPKTGKPYRISNLISQVLGVAVDNAKEQLLGAFGINQLNLSVVLTITRAGFGFRFSKAFINQPILKEYYRRIGETEDIYNIDYTANKRQAVVDDLFKEYTKKFAIKSNVQDREGIQGFKLSELISQLGQQIDESNAEMQLEVLKAYLRYKDISDSIQAVSSAFNIDAKGLPKNMSETARKAESIDAILQNDKILGNVEKYAATTIPGLFLGVPARAVNLFMNPSSPLFAYNTTSYVNAKTLIAFYSGKSTLYDDQINAIHNHIKQYVYSGFDIDKVGRRDLPNHVLSERERLLFDYDNNDSLQTRVLRMKELYPNNDLLSSIDISVPENVHEPRLLNIQMSNEDDYVQKMSEYWENMINDDANPELQAVAKDLVKYALWINPQEYGPTNIIKYIPFSYLEKIGFGDYLNTVNESLSSENDPLTEFVEQFILHNNDFLASVRETTKDGAEVFVSNSAVWEKEMAMGADNVLSERNKVLNSFKLPAIDTNNMAANPAVNLVRRDEENEGAVRYPKYLRFYNNEKFGTQVYKGSENKDGTYTYERVGRLGNANMSEYLMGGQASSAVLNNVTTAAKPQVDVNPVRSVIGNTIPQTPGSEPRESQAFNYLKPGNSADDIIGGIIETANSIIADSASSKVDKAYAGLFQFLATRLHNSGLDKVKIVLDKDAPASGNTTRVGDDVTITINPTFTKRGRTGLSPELEQQRTILHELIHAKVFTSPLGKDSKEYKDVEAVWNAYKRAIIDNSSKGEIRGIPVSILDAELLGTLKNLFNENKGNDLGATSFADFVSKAVNDEALMDKILGRTGLALSKIPGLESKNTDLVTNKNRRAEFKEYLLKEFASGEMLGDKINKYYAYHDINEFFTEALTNRKLQGILHRTPGLWKQFIDTVKDIIAKILGITSTERTLMDDSIDAVFKYIGLKGGDIKTEIEQNPPAAPTERKPGEVGSKENPHRMAMNFRDGDGGRSMRPEFKGKSTMELILSGDRTATSRDLGKDYNAKDVKPGDHIEFTDNLGNKANAVAQTSWYPVSEVTAEQWSKLEGWAPSLYAAVSKKGYHQFIFKLEKEAEEEQKGSEDTFRYYGATYTIVRDANGQAIDVVGYKGKYENKKALMDAYNNNPDVDPQNGKYFRNEPPAAPPTSVQEGAALDRLYTKPDGTVIKFNDQQFNSLKDIKGWAEGKAGQFYCLAGYAGTGKTTIVNAAIQGLKKVAVSAPTHKAKKVIAKSTGRPAVTIQSLLGLKPNTDIEDFDINNIQFDTFNKPKISEYRYIVLDEASMLNKDLFEMLLEKAKETGTKILFMGDPAQLPPVGEDISEVFTSKEIKSRSELTKVERQADGNPLMGVYDAIRNNISSAIDAFAHRTKLLNGQGIKFFSKALDFEDKAEELFGSEAYKNDKNYVKILSWTNDGVTNWNKRIRKFLFGEGVRVVEPTDTLTAYNSVVDGEDEILTNSADYSVVSVEEVTNAYGIQVYRTAMSDVDDKSNRTTIDLVVPTTDNLAKVRTLLGNLYREFDKLPKGKRGAAWSAYESTKAKHLFMTPFSLGNVSAYGKEVKIGKDIDYGYALTVHKSQGSTYSHVLVDEANIDKLADRSFTDFLYGKELEKASWKGSKLKYSSSDDFFLKKQVEKNKLKYVAFSRPTSTVYALSKSVIPETKKVVRGDVFDPGRVPVIPTNMGGKHGAGLAQSAVSKGLIKEGEGTFGGSKLAIRFPVKQVWRDAASLDIMKESFRKFTNAANKNKNLNFAFPLVGLGHGEGKIEEIIPMIAQLLRDTDNVTLVLPADDISLGRQGTVRQDKTRENMPAILEALKKEGFDIESSDDISAYSKENEVLGQLMNMGVITIHCK